MMDLRKMPRGLTNDELARLLLRILWQMQDAGGVSGGRALRSLFLEAVPPLLPELDVPNMDRFSAVELLDESEQRVRNMMQIGCDQQMLFPELAFAESRTLAVCILFRLKELYTEDAEREDQLPMEELRIVSAAVSLLPPYEDCMPFNDCTYGDLLNESSERNIWRIKRETSLLHGFLL